MPTGKFYQIRKPMNKYTKYSTNGTNSDVIFLDARIWIFIKCCVLVPRVCDGSQTTGISWDSLENTLAYGRSSFWIRLRTASIDIWKSSQWAFALRTKVQLTGQEATVNCACGQRDIERSINGSVGMMHLMLQSLKAFVKLSANLHGSSS